MAITNYISMRWWRVLSTRPAHIFGFLLYRHVCPFGPCIVCPFSIYGLTDYLFGIFKFFFLLIDLYFLILIVFLFDFSLPNYVPTFWKVVTVFYDYILFCCRNALLTILSHFLGLILAGFTLFSLVGVYSKRVGQQLTDTVNITGNIFSFVDLTI